MGLPPSVRTDRLEAALLIAAQGQQELGQVLRLADVHVVDPDDHVPSIFT